MTSAPERIRVALADRMSGALFERWPSLGLHLSALETRVVRSENELPAIERPVYVCGMARSGSTLLLELLNGAPGFTAHRYGDYPMLWTPFWWNRLRERLPQATPRLQERAHADGIKVSRESPEAFEEVFWQHFFAGRADPGVDQVLEKDARNVAFDSFYTLHIRKLLAARRATRYLAKANGNLTRLGYLHSLFPDLRVVIPIREPVSHVASLVRQDRRFCALVAREPAIGRHLCRIGHREFGPGKRAVNVGDTETALAIQTAFESGDIDRAYALQWTVLHAWLIARLASDPELARVCLLVRHDQLCTHPQRILTAVFNHAGIDGAAAQALTGRCIATIRTPESGLTDLDPSLQQDVYGATARTWRELCRLAG